MRPARLFLAVMLVLALIGLGGLRAWRDQAPVRMHSGNEPVRVEVRRPREDLILVRDAGGPWTVARQDDLADADAVERLLSGLRSLTIGAPVAPPSGGFASGLGPADAVRVRVLDAAGGVLFDGLFGRRLLGSTVYFRASDRDHVRVASGLDPELLLRSSAQWREPRLLPGGCADGLEVMAHGRWRPVAADTAKALCSLRAAHWAAGALEGLAGFELPLLRARTPDGRGFHVGERRGRERLVKVEGRRALLRVHAAVIEAAAADLVP